MNVTVFIRYQKRWRTPPLCFPASRETIHEILTSRYGLVEFDLGQVTPSLYLADVSRLSTPTAGKDLDPACLSREERAQFDAVIDYIEECRRTLRALLGKRVRAVIDRPVGTRHPKRPETVYPINYGYLEDVLSADGEGADVYVLGSSVPLAVAEGTVIAVVHREDDIEDKLVISVDPTARYTAKEIEDAIFFQEKAYCHSVEVQP